MMLNVQLSSQTVTIWQDATMIAWMGVFVGIVAIATPIVMTFKQQSHKQITCRVRDDTPVIVNKNAVDKITVLVNGQPATDLHLVTLGVWNSGNVSVKAQDYIHPIIVTFPGRKVQYADIQRWSPDDLITEKDLEAFLEENTKLRQNQPSSVKLPIIHLNPTRAAGIQNSYTIRVLLTGPESPPHIEGMLNDGRVINYDSQHDQSQVKRIWLTIASIISLLLLVFLF
jgi:hypothetical protein